MIIQLNNKNKQKKTSWGPLSLKLSSEEVIGVCVALAARLKKRRETYIMVSDNFAMPSNRKKTK